MPVDFELLNRENPDLHLKGDEKSLMLFSPIETKANTSDDNMEFSGYVSTSSPDLANDIVEPMSFSKHLYRYLNNPVYCYQHDKMNPIGRVNNPYIDTKGLYLDQIKLTPIPDVVNIIWPLIKDKVLSQQSIGFLVMDGKREKDFFRITESFLMESSLVTVACNPEAVIDLIKSKGNVFNEQGEFKYGTLPELRKAYETGEIQYKREIEKQYALGGIPLQKETPTGETMTKTESPLTPDFGDAKAIRLTQEQKGLIDQEGTPTSVPNKYQKNHDQVASLIYAAKSSRASGGYMFRIADPTEKGFAYNKEAVVITMGRMLGAKGGAFMEASEKEQIIERLGEAYDALGLAIPQVKFEGESVDVTTLNVEALEEVKYADVEFRADESVIIENAIIRDALKSVIPAIERQAESKKLTADNIALLKSFYMDVRIYGGVYDETDVDELNQIAALIVNQREEREAAYRASQEGAYAEYNAPEGEIKAEEPEDELAKALAEFNTF